MLNTLGKNISRRHTEIFFWFFPENKRELILVLFVRLFDLRLFGFVGFLFLLVSKKGCGLWRWHSLDFSLTFFWHFMQIETFCMKVKTLISGKDVINLSSDVLAHRVLKVNVTLLYPVQIYLGILPSVWYYIVEEQKTATTNFTKMPVSFHINAFKRNKRHCSR